ncbi:hypothetical protein [Chlorobium sp.]|nr:hypothetical protein [Chlorobium sp.]
MNSSEFLIYQAADGKITIDVRLEADLRKLNSPRKPGRGNE